MCDVWLKYFNSSHIVNYLIVLIEIFLTFGFISSSLIFLKFYVLILNTSVINIIPNRVRKVTFKFEREMQKFLIS